MSILISRRICAFLLGLAFTRRTGVGNTPQVVQSQFTSPITDLNGSISYRFICFAGTVTLDLGGGQSIRFACIPGGEGVVGSNRQWEFLRLKSTPIRKVLIRPFLLGTFEVTQGQWLQVSRLPKVNRDLIVYFPSTLSAEQSSWPVEEPISFLQAREFCDRVSAHTGVALRLPSEAEWEVSCRAGTSSEFYFGDNYERDISNSEVISTGRFRPVGSKNAPNRYGLHDMYGGMTEWCEDFTHNDYTGAPLDGNPWLAGGDNSIRIVRGYFGGRDGGSAARSSFLAAGYFTTLGMRVAASLDHGIWDPVVSACVHGADYSSGPISAGQVVALFGTRIGSQEAAPGQIVEGSVSGRLGGVEVYFDEFKAPILYASSGQINAIVPFGIVGRRKVRAVVRNGFQSAKPLELEVATAKPALFALDGSGGGPAAAVNEDGRINGIQDGARRGSMILLYGSGFGSYAAGFSDGEIPIVARALVNLPEVIIGGRSALVHYAGAAPGLVAGVVQLNVVVPENSPSGAVDVVVVSAGIRSNPGATIFVA